MRRVALGARTYFIREAGDPEREYVLFAVLRPGSSSDDDVTHTAEVFMQDDSGRIVPVWDELTVEMVKAAAAPTGPAKAIGSAWKNKFLRWLNKQIEAGNVKLAPAEKGKVWVITRTKEDVFRELDVKISLDTFDGATRKRFRYQGLPLRWANLGGRPKTKGS